MCEILWNDVVYVNSALSIICLTCPSALLYMNMITHSLCVFVFGLNVILFHVSQQMTSYMLEMERLSLFQGNALINGTSGHEILFHMLQFHE